MIVGEYENKQLSDSDIFSLTQGLKDREALRRVHFTTSLISIPFDRCVSRQPLVAVTVPLSVLRAEYSSGTFIAKIDWLSAHGWTGLRRSRGDGDCFYRSMAFAYVERIMDAPDQNYAAATSLSTIEIGVEDLKLVGFEPVVVSNPASIRRPAAALIANHAAQFEDFFEVLRDLILNIVQPDLEGKLMTPLSMLERFQDPYGVPSVKPPCLTQH